MPVIMQVDNNCLLERQSVTYTVSERTQFTLFGTGSVSVKFKGVVVADLTPNNPTFIAKASGEYELSISGGSCRDVTVHADPVVASTSGDNDVVVEQTHMQILSICVDVGDGIITKAYQHIQYDDRGDITRTYLTDNESNVIEGEIVDCPCCESEEPCQTRLEKFSNSKVTFTDVTDLVLKVLNGTAEMSVNNGGGVSYGNTGVENNVHQSEKHDGDIVIDGSAADFIVEWRSCDGNYVIEGSEPSVIAINDFYKRLYTTKFDIDNNYTYRVYNDSENMDILSNDLGDLDPSSVRIIGSDDGKTLSVAGGEFIVKPNGLVDFIADSEYRVVDPDILSLTASFQYTVDGVDGVTSNVATVLVRFDEPA